MEEVDRDEDLSPQGRQRKKRRIGMQALADLQTAKELENARAAVDRQMQLWEQRLGLVLTQPDDAPSAILHWEVRDKFSKLKDERERMSFLERFGDDPQVASALSNGPVGLTNLSKAERAMLRTKIDQHIPAEVVEGADIVCYKQCYPSGPSKTGQTSSPTARHYPIQNQPPTATGKRKQ